MPPQADQGAVTGAILTTALATFITGYLFGVFTSRGYFISPALSDERRRNRTDPVESDESDVDEDDSLLDHAPNWANSAQADRKQGLRVVAGGEAAGGDKAAATLKDGGEECKLVLVCSHATLACFKALSHAAPGSPQRAILARWERLGQAKIAVQVKGQDEILELRRRARDLGLTAEVIRDAGRTQIEAGSMTVLGVGPAPKSLVDQVTGQLKLL
ncbi:Peptidyl-tRNA hydrolase 2 [Tolypocladium capitatum]|uniref:peptidyl-tRNA hydrolase n=1 Tax=Tolypocladium capitatum TaxID=45235 RepID=A0A2K3PXF4_9HYPO|nr:Peptidyl-tRNA hydrolase 2 [Tolypocladium capitatum]